ncbi:hypothetical protein BJ508DRAFT_416117 [Ascobolus immersus RN42]|uniref:Exosome complex component CSL4 C-terminal domain-containing protein n=1 Tax=Ascobolus immersus RN42 TaxID=1160509 RepID=A0A3N4I3E2_ASCIM|nr:hypothetical protein BJ508DRAFT_416117 [Ascobolus immersus RN42]
MAASTEISQLPTIVLPGQSIVPTTAAVPGPGTLVSSVTGSIHSTILGTPKLTTEVGAALPKLSIEPPSAAAPLKLPDVGDNVYARVTKISRLEARLEVLGTEDASGGGIGLAGGSEGWGGVLRKLDLRERDRDRAEVGKCVRVGDIVRAKVISLGDQSNYFLSTAGNSLGVVVARAENGELMAPRSWKDMVGLRSGCIEERKVAKPL